MASLPEQCCTLPPFKSNYTPTGNYVTLSVSSQQDMRVYAAGPADAETAIVCVYDIFGLHVNTLQGVDHLARAYGGRVHVVLPDLFRGEAWPVDNLPPKEGPAALSAWVAARGRWDVVRPALLAVVQRLRANGSKKIGAYGFCFGAKILVQSSAENLFAASAFVHPSFFAPEDGDTVSAPVALLPSSGEDKAVMDEFWARVQKKGGTVAEKSIRQDFLDVNHGFAASRANWADERLAGRARDAFEALIKFFQSTL